MSVIDHGATRSPTRSGDGARLRLIHCVANHNRHPTSMTDVFAKICDKAIGRGWQFEVIAPEVTRGSTWTEMLSDRGATIHHLDAASRTEHGKGVAAVLAGDDAPALLHTHLTGYDVPAAKAARSRSDVSVFWHFHSFLPSGLKPALRLRVKFQLYRRSVDRLVAQSENIADGLRRGGVPDKRIFMFRSGIDPDNYPLRTHEQHMEERRKLGVPDSAVLLLHFGYDWQVKGGDRFFAAVRELVDSGMEVVALVNRGGEDADRNAAELGLTDVVRNEGLVDDTWPLYAAADCMVAPSRGEGMPFSLVEALATGLPVVASELPGHRYLGDRIAGCSVVEPEPAALADAIRAAVGRPRAEAQADAELGRDWILENLNADAVIEELFDAYDQALTARGVTT